ncbi:MAG: sugar transporter permease, partial [Pseudarthrobacter sp.]|nr:sugar transporter permease [Pseudarthrobacter sp.]
MTTLAQHPTPASAAPASPKPHGSYRRFGDLRIALFFIAPAMIGFIVFYVVPTIRGVYLSFTEYNILGDPEWVGVDNYTAIAKDPLFWNSLAVTGQYVFLNIVLQTALALGLALLMNKVAKSTLIRGALLLPWMMSNIIAALLWFWMLDYQIGVVNQFIEWAGLPRVAF